MKSTRLRIDQYLTERRTIGALNQRSAAACRSVLYAFAEIAPLDPAKIRRRNVIRWMGTLGHLSANARRSYFGRVRGFCRWLQQRGVLDRDPFAEIDAPRKTRPVHRALDQWQVNALVAACGDDRDLVILMLGLHTGLRRAELAALEVGDVAISAQTVTVRFGKGGHGRIVPMAEECAAIVGSYIAAHGLRAGPLLRSHVNPTRGIQPATVGKVFRDLAHRAQVKVAAFDGIGTHSTRHTCATDVYLRTRDVLIVRDLLGHVELSTTQVYVRGLDLDGMRAAVEGRTYLGPAA